MKEFSEEDSKKAQKGEFRVRDAYRRACLNGPMWMGEAYIAWEEELTLTLTLTLTLIGGLDRVGGGGR